MIVEESQMHFVPKIVKKLNMVATQVTSRNREISLKCCKK